MPQTNILGHFTDFINFLSIFPHRMCQFFYVNSWFAFERPQMGFLKQQLVQGKNVLIIYHSLVVPTINLMNQYKCKSLPNSATRKSNILESSKISKESLNIIIKQ